MWAGRVRGRGMYSSSSAWRCVALKVYVFYVLKTPRGGRGRQCDKGGRRACQTRFFYSHLCSENSWLISRSQPGFALRISWVCGHGTRQSAKRVKGQCHVPCACRAAVSQSAP